ncbi:phosphotransferase family protein [Yinghuangia soli]|uniref:Phosphotransferase family protein n=1 Tax=Yinghuangia soli TaxID=2908204 RepID=A0AA41Q8L5_9ACTN|nr:phosphotransferase family protein [Yinghuangia soli]MCF2533613.1 phosphotransferase family protein [Yinghuangia soli]
MNVTNGQPPADTQVQRTSRDTAEVPAALARWLATKLPPGAEPAVRLHSGIDANGMSNETLVFDVVWQQDGARRTAEYVARVAPSPADVPVYENYALQDQYDTMQIVRRLSEVPIPRVEFMEASGDVLGMPFFLMERLAGVVPPDVLPYTYGDNWLFDASPEDRRRLQDSTVKALAGLHAIPDAATTFAFLDPKFPGATVLQRNVARTRAWYDFAARGLGRSPLTERALQWLESHVPDAGETVLVWGDARLGNVIYADFEPVGILDWDMASIGPRELDLSWLIFAHRVFQSLTDVFGLPGLPDFLREEDVVATYTDLTGARIGDLHWYHVHAAVNWAVLFMRVGARSIHFGQTERPEDIETLLHHRPLFESLVADLDD